MFPGHDSLLDVLVPRGRARPRHCAFYDGDSNCRCYRWTDLRCSLEFAWYRGACRLAVVVPHRRNTRDHSRIPRFCYSARSAPGRTLVNCGEQAWIISRLEEERQAEPDHVSTLKEAFASSRAWML